MALLGLSIVMASVIFFCLRKPLWLPAFLGRSSSAPPCLGPPRQEEDDREQPMRPNDIKLEKSRERSGSVTTNDTKTVPPAASSTGRFAASPTSPVIIADDPSSISVDSMCDEEQEEQTTPKASVSLTSDSVPSFSLSVPEPTPAPAPPVAARPVSPPPSNLMGPPPLPSVREPQPQPSQARQPLASAHAAGSSTLPLPNRSGPSPLPDRAAGAGLAPPPTLTSKPKKPTGKEIALAPGHSPLDWARLTKNGAADLRNLPPGTNYLRVTPTMLRHYTGRKGKDAWTVLGGKVYNITPYLPFHPGGEPELLRCAARDGTKLFGEIHPWVNYEQMLAACLVGIFVPEETKPEEETKKYEDVD